MADNQLSKSFTTSEDNVVSRQKSKHTEQTYTIDDAIDKMGFGPFQLLIYFFCGFLWIADAMEVMILSILSPAVKCQWDLSSAEEAVITSVVFAGSLVGSLCWGVFGDTFGRKKALFVANLTILISGVLSALKLSANDDRIPGYPWMILCRFGVGFGAAGIVQVSTYYIEFLPKRMRAVCTVFVSAWWGIGTMFGAALAVGVMRPGSLGWHWYLGLCAIPIGLSLFYFPFIPESARFYLVHGKKAKAEKVLKKIAWFNMKSLPKGRLVSPEEKAEEEEENSKRIKTETASTLDSSEPFKDSNLDTDAIMPENDEKYPLIIHNDEKMHIVSGKFAPKKNVTRKILDLVKSLRLLFTNGMWKVTIILSFLWFGSAWIYYGNVLLTSTILQDNPHCDAKLANNETLYIDADIDEDGSNSTICEHQLDTGDYLRIMWTTGAELPGLFVTITIIEIIGRKLTMAFNFTMILLGFCLLFICTNEALLTFFLFITRAFSTGVFQTMYVYTPEVYPTKVRGIGMGVLYSVARIGAIVTPYVAQVLFQTSDYATIGLYAGSSLVLIAMALLLPIETKGKALRDER